MKLVFKKSDSNITDPMLGDTNFLAHYTGANASMAFAEIAPGIRQATEKFVLPWIGEPYYSEMAQKFDTDATLSAHETRAMELLQDCVAYYTAYHVLPERNAFLASMGAVQNVPTGGSQPASQWSWKAKRWSALENGDRFLDLLLAHMDARAAANDTAFNTWKNSDTYNQSGSIFFRKTEDLEGYLNIQQSRRTFLSIVKWLRKVELNTARPLLCDDQIGALKTQILGGTLTDNNKKLVELIRQLVAPLALIEALPHHRIVIDGDGFRVVSQTDQFDDRRNQTNSIHENAILALENTARADSKRAHAELRAFLNTNADLYPLWANSPCAAYLNQSGNDRHRIVGPSDGRGGFGIF